MGRVALKIKAHRHTDHTDQIHGGDHEKPTARARGGATRSIGQIELKTNQVMKGIRGRQGSRKKTHETASFQCNEARGASNSSKLKTVRGGGSRNPQRQRKPFLA